MESEENMLSIIENDAVDKNHIIAFEEYNVTLYFLKNSEKNGLKTPRNFCLILMNRECAVNKKSF